MSMNWVQASAWIISLQCNGNNNDTGTGISLFLWYLYLSKLRRQYTSTWHLCAAHLPSLQLLSCSKMPSMLLRNTGLLNPSPSQNSLLLIMSFLPGVNTNKTKHKFIPAAKAMQAIMYHDSPSLWLSCLSYVVFYYFFSEVPTLQNYMAKVILTTDKKFSKSQALKKFRQTWVLSNLLE